MVDDDRDLGSWLLAITRDEPTLDCCMFCISIGNDDFIKRLVVAIPLANRFVVFYLDAGLTIALRNALGIGRSRFVSLTR